MATIVLATREDITAIIIVIILAHSLCTGLVVLGCLFIAQKISVWMVTLVGKVVYILFILTTLLMDLETLSRIQKKKYDVLDEDALLFHVNSGNDRIFSGKLRKNEQ